MRTFQRISRLIRPAIGLPVLAALAIVGLLVMALGCGEKREAAATTAPAVNPRLQDVPVPAGFKFNTDQSSDRAVGGFRFVRHLYEGGATVRQVSEFYRRNMPPLGWQMLEENFVSGRRRLLYDKGNDTCHISVWDDWGTKVLIQVLPRGARHTRPAAPAPSAGTMP
ncbi:MAG TPA: hypothetical protein VM238_22065 [Phycisphaerae bacterium]|nr:hypothetical protein [Phycisphaerae bacterium]